MITPRADGRVAMETVARLNAQIAELRAHLAQLQANVAQAEREASRSRALTLMEANEKLLIAALNADNVAEAAQSDLEALAKVSHRDALTDTPNRVLMLDRLEMAISSARRHKSKVAVFFVDIDHFKQINDTFGHAAGDDALQLVARRLQSVVRESDTVSRYGGDEFVVLLPHVSGFGAAAQIAAKMQTAIAEPARIQGYPLDLAISIGVAMYPEDGAEPATLIASADRAMYSRRRQQRGR